MTKPHKRMMAGLISNEMCASGRCDRDGEGRDLDDDDSGSRLGDGVEDWTTEEAATEDDDADVEKAYGCWVS